MNHKSRTLEATIRKHWRTLVSGGVWIDAYNQSVNTAHTGTILARLNACNHYYVTHNPKP